MDRHSRVFELLRRRVRSFLRVDRCDRASTEGNLPFSTHTGELYHRVWRCPAGVEGIDQRVVKYAAYSGWQDDPDALKQVKVELRKILKEQALPFKDGDATFDSALAYIVENF